MATLRIDVETLAKGYGITLLTGATLLDEKGHTKLVLEGQTESERRK